MKIITICGSLKFQKEMMEEARKYALRGYCVLTPVYTVNNNDKLSDEQLDFLKKSHFKKIELSDEILVINKDNYIGESTKLEIEYAKKLNKNIIYFWGDKNE